MVIQWLFNQCGGQLVSQKARVCSGASVESVENLSVKVETLSLTWNEMKVMPRVIKKKKNSYLSNLSSVLDGLKLIEKLFQRSTTFLLMMRSNSIDFEGELMIEGKKVVFSIFLKLTVTVPAGVSGSRQLVCRLQGVC